METKTFITAEKSSSYDDEKMTLTHFITTVTPDRYGEIVNPYGMDSRNFRKNPVVLFGHNASKMVIGKNLSLRIDDFGVKATTQFADTEVGREIYRLNRDGFLNAWSIGFIPKKVIHRGEKKNDSESFTVIEEWELIEYSSVVIPANPDSLNLLLKEVRSDEMKLLLRGDLSIENFLKRIEQLELKSQKLESDFIKLENKIADKFLEIIKLIQIINKT
ncbi:MAG: HK97 family phage prohead protease [Ignavibacteria bacterium]